MGQGAWLETWVYVGVQRVVRFSHGTVLFMQVDTITTAKARKKFLMGPHSSQGLLPVLSVLVSFTENPRAAGLTGEFSVLPFYGFADFSGVPLFSSGISPVIAFYRSRGGAPGQVPRPRTFF